MKKILTNVLLALALLAFGATCFAEAETFTGESQGFGGPVSVTLTIEDGVITDAVVTGEQETPGIGAAAVEPLAELIVAAQVLNRTVTALRTEQTTILRIGRIGIDG